jgi:hypothetical protein
MSSFRTFFRTVVMLATLGLIAKFWHQCGPSFNELKDIGARVRDVAQEEWTKYWQASPNDALANDPRVPQVGNAPAPFEPQGTPMAPMPHAPQLVPTDQAGSVQLAGGIPTDGSPQAVGNPSTPWPPAPPAEPMRLPGDIHVPAEDPQLTAALEKLTQWGVRDQELRPWGSTGDLMRFSCSMPWGNSAAYSRHFEAVAATPIAAVEQVAFEIEAWQRGER